MDEIVRMTAEQWENYACEAHLLAFSVDRPTSFDRTHFALMYVKNKAPYMFVSCHEMDAETCYIQFGGTFQPERKDPSAFRAYLKMLGVLLTTYKRLTTKIKNTNTAMLKPAMRAGFRVVGMSVHNGEILLDHVMEMGALNG